MSPVDLTRPQGDARRYPGAQVRLRPCLRWTDATGPHEAWISTRAVIGSAPDVDLVIADPAVSRLHAEVDPTDSGLWAHDLGSRNGTFIEEIRVQTACLPPGGRLRVGDTDLRVEYGSAPAEV